MKNWKVGITLGCVCCILTLAICVQIKTIDSVNVIVPQTLTGNKLRDQVMEWEEKRDKAEEAKNVSEQQKKEELENSTTKLEEVRLLSTQNDENSISKEEEIKLDNILLGLTDVKGDGIVITLKDNNTVKRSDIGPLDNIELYLVHAGDLVEVVNALKNAGAEAISINGQRITNYSSIYCAGNVVVINGEKISSPIEIKAIGSPDLLYGSLRIPGGYIQLLEETGVIVDIKKQKNIIINKYNGILNTQYINSVE